MRKSDVATRYERGQELPAVNVKVNGSITAKILADVEKETGEAGFAAWGAALLERDAWPDWTWEAACESGWETLQRDAEEVFGRGVKVESAGRSGGWCIVRGLPELASWDAIMLGKWARFARWAGQTAQNVPWDMAMLLAINTCAQEREKRSAISTAAHAAESQVS